MQSLDPFHPTEFGRYWLEERLAVGGMAEIFRAKSFGAHGFQKTLVIKRILPDLGKDDQFIEMFIEEARMMTKLTHPKIVQVLDFGEVDGRYYIAMEYVSGMDLLEMLRTCAKRRVRPTTAIAVHVMAEVLDALDYAHALKSESGVPLGIVHSDVSPSNIFISHQGEVKLGDFGIARVHTGDGRREAGTLRGKYGYMSPEQVSGRSVDGRADVFAAGIVLAELLMIRRLFIAKNDLEVLLQVRDARLDRLYRFGQRIPGDLMTIIESALARDPALRYQTAALYRDALHRYLFDNRRMIRASDVRRFLARLRDDAPLAPLIAQARAAAPEGESQTPFLDEDATAEPLVSVVDEPRPASELSPDETTPPLTTMATVEAPAEMQERLLGAGADTPPVAPPKFSEPRMGELAVGTPSVVGRKRRIQIAPPPTPEPVPHGLPHTGEEPRLATDHALAAAPELGSSEASSNRDFRTRDSDDAIEPPNMERVETPEPEEIAAQMMTPITGVPKMAMPELKGDLHRQSLFRVTFGLAIKEDTGLLVLRQDDAVKEIYLVDGHPHYVSSNQAEELFGQYLVKRGVLASGELSMALAMLSHFEGRLGDTLVALKLMRPMQVLRHLTYQVREKLLNAFAWTEGSYLYYRDAECAHESAPLGLDAYELMGAGANRISRQIIQAGLEPHLDAKLVSSVPAPVPPEVFRLGDLPRQVCEKLNGARSLRQLLVRFDDPIEQESFERAVYLLLETGLVTP